MDTSLSCNVASLSWRVQCAYSTGVVRAWALELRLLTLVQYTSAPVCLCVCVCVHVVFSQEGMLTVSVFIG